MAIVFKDFGTAYLAAPLAVGGLTITVDSPSSLPVLQAGDYFYLVLQKYSDRSYVEIVKVTATAGSTYTIQRGQAGTVARAFALGDYAELRLTVDALSEFIAQGIATKMDKSGGGDFVGQYRFLNSNTSRIDVVRTSDNTASSVVLDFSASEGHRAIFGGPAGSNVITPNILLRPNGYGNGTGQLKIDKDGLVDAVALVMRGATQRTEAGAAVRYDELDKFVPKTRTINGHDLTTDFSVTADDVFAAGATVSRNARFQASDFQYRQADGAYGLRFAVSSAIAYLQGGKTDSSVDQKMHLTGWMGSPLSSFKVYAENPLIRRAAGVDYPLYDALNKPTIADVTGLATQLAAAQSRIAELESWPQQGSNANGEWVKFQDGTMICRLTAANVDCPVDSAYGVLFTGNYIWTFPQPFVSPPTVPAPSMRISTAASWGSVATLPAASYVQLRIIDAFKNTERNKTHVEAVAIGRWK